MFGSLASLIVCTFQYNTNFNWQNKYSTGLKAFPLYALCVTYKVLSISTMIALLRFYAILPIFMILSILGILVYYLSSTTNTHNEVNFLRPGMKPYLSLFTMPVFHSERSKERDFFDIPDAIYLKWFRMEGITSFLVHLTILGTLAVLWKLENKTVRENFPGATLWPWEDYSSACPRHTVKGNLPVICLVIILIGVLNLFFTILFTYQYPEVWHLNQTQESMQMRKIDGDKMSQEDVRAHRLTQNVHITKGTLPNLSDFEKYRANCRRAGAGEAAFTHRVVLSPVHE